MSYTRLYSCAIPQPYWEGVTNGIDLISFADDAMSCERRITKDVNLENEHDRYTLLCQRLEMVVIESGLVKPVRNASEFQSAVKDEKFPLQMMHPGYLALIARVQGDESWERFGASFFPPDQVRPHLQKFSTWANQHALLETELVQQLCNFYTWAERMSCGMIEVQSSFHKCGSNFDEMVAPYVSQKAEVHEVDTFVEIPVFTQSELESEIFEKSSRKKRLADVLRRQIRAALESGEPVSFGNQAPHDVITEVLHEFVFVPPESSIQSAQIRVVYSDGSEAKPFPVFCLPTPKHDESRVQPLRAALMSMRHLELDPNIDFCWFRNREVSRTRTLSESDQFCYEATLEQLSNSLELDDLILHLYHTGFEPAVIGFYRGVTQTLLEMQGNGGHELLVTPYFFRGKHGYQQGSTWR